MDQTKLRRIHDDDDDDDDIILTSSPRYLMFYTEEERLDNLISAYLLSQTTRHIVTEGVDIRYTWRSHGQ
jgi:hypothetical protein